MGSVSDIIVDREALNTIKGQLDLIKNDDVRNKALHNLVEMNGNLAMQQAFGIAHTISQALAKAFPWHSTPEGFNYWHNIFWECEQAENKF